MSFLRRAGRVAVASSIHGNVQRRQRTRWAAEDQARAAQAQPVPPIPDLPPLPPQAAPAAPAASMDLKLEQLTKLGELKNAGVLSEAEFETQKARILA
ncbi:SHOCT domain-containing protein [Rhodococcus qingshengii]|uniref:SHOCT domain-containing protein n=1 Tax=Rhodococcus qingshengii TaxID=334542 RepID=UPI0005A79B74|nr:SHOCT domain-containing protein [Rhodococcus qingshengii]MBW4816644.1 SHOCT domain-containing protein [Rhodococcus qingshengii]MCD2135518.1 SHOCT domain-containing protein [Rhodococcus qingshengii]QOS65715.1 SHOCT domain-containing protein [Rhodococcus qingshengii]